jgi:hypothetical protein
VGRASLGRRIHATGSGALRSGLVTGAIQSVNSQTNRESEVLAGACSGAGPRNISKGLILAQNERWRRGLGMQVVRSARGVAQG